MRVIRRAPTPLAAPSHRRSAQPGHSGHSTLLASNARGSALALSLLALAACGSSPPPAPAEASPRPASTVTGEPKAEAKDPAASDAATIDALTSQEAKSGTCDADHKLALEKVLEEVETRLRVKVEDGKPIKIESFSKRTLALSDSARGFSLTLSGKGTQVHVVAVGAKEISLDALAAGTAATTMRSPFQREEPVAGAKITLAKTTSPTVLQSDSRQIEMKPGAPLEVKLRGQGCVGVVVFSKL